MIKSEQNMLPKLHQWGKDRVFA